MAKILISDDAESIREMTKEILIAEGHTVIETADGQEALEVVKKVDDIELFLLDVNMPNLDGISLSRKIRISPHYKFTPIIVLTTERGEFVRKDGKQSGCTGWVLKPIEEKKIIQTISELLDE